MRNCSAGRATSPLNRPICGPSVQMSMNRCEWSVGWCGEDETAAQNMQMWHGHDDESLGREQLQFVQRFWVGEQFTRQSPGHLGCVFQCAVPETDRLARVRSRVASQQQLVWLTCAISHGTDPGWEENSADSVGTVDRR